MFVLVESGATKSDWLLVGEDGKLVQRFSLSGMNLSAMSLRDVEGVLDEALLRPGLEDVSGFYIYAAGVATDSIRNSIRDFVRERLGAVQFDLQDDMVAAARSVCGRSPGIVAILGTGSNSCMYDGSSVFRPVRSGGYIIGDEGGAAVLGKNFLSDFIKNEVPPGIADAFSLSFASDYASIVDGVYHSASPSAYLGSIAPFLCEHRDNEYVRGLIDANFEAFIRRALKKYDVDRYEVGVVGGFGYACREMFSDLAARHGIRISRFVKSPLEGLLEYHRESR